MSTAPTDHLDLPDGWSARIPVGEDVPGLTSLVAAHQVSAKGSASVDEETIAALVIGPGSWTRRQVLVLDEAGTAVAWTSVHDRASGRTMVDVTVAPDHPEGDRVAVALLGWCSEVALGVARQRGREGTQLDALVYVDDARQRDWYAAAGYSHTRSYLNMTRPVADAPSLPEPREGVTVRRVATHENDVPVASDLQVVHQVLEESFEDHFNSYRESFPEFVQRLREDTGHRWDHWFLAEVETEDGPVAGGALVGSVLSADSTGAGGTYVDYIGVHRRARGRGVAKALLHTVIQDAHDRGRNRVNLEVDADSPTGADGLYTSMGWTTAYRTESWQADLDADGVSEPAV